MSAIAYILLAIALAIVAFIAWLFFSGPDQDAIDAAHKSARPYDSFGDGDLPRCTGGCHQGRKPCDCDTELSGTHSPLKLQLVRSVPSRPPIQLTGGRVSRRKRLRLFIRFLQQRNFLD